MIFYKESDPEWKKYEAQFETAAEHLIAKKFKVRKADTTIKEYSELANSMKLLVKLFYKGDVIGLTSHFENVEEWAVN